MTRDKLVAMVARRLGFRTDLDEAIVDELQLAQAQLEGQGWLPWFLRKSEVLVGVDGEQTLALPEDFLAEVPSQALFLRTATDSWEVPRKSRGEAIAITRYSPQGTPRVFSREGGEGLELWPIPDSGMEFLLRYFARQPLLDGGGAENKWSLLYPDLLVGKAGMAVAQTLQSQPLFAGFAEMADLAYGAMLARDGADENNATRPALGGYGRT